MKDRVLGLIAFLLVTTPAIAGEPPTRALYAAKVTFQFKADVVNPLQAISAHFPKGDTSVSLSAVGNNDLFELTVLDADPKIAASRANELAVGLQAAWSKTTVNIWKKAE